jgi:2,3-dihydro-2,3-dihydroxybenzoate dehydrogenase
VSGRADEAGTSVSLNGRVALVTGASRGIGRMIAIGLASRGAAVYAAARDSGRLNQLAAEPSAHGRITPLVVDLTSARAEETLGREVAAVDIVVSAAAAPLRHATLLETGERVWRDQWLISVDVPRRLIGWAAPLMKERGGGSFVFLSTVAARQPLAGLSAYGVAKAALDALMRSAALELGRFGIRCNSVAPGLVHTERTHELISATPLAAEHRRTTPRGELTSAADIADIVTWLVSSQSGGLTGQVLTADGGRSIGTYRAPD